MNRLASLGVSVLIILVIIVAVGWRLFVSVPVGHVGVASLFGKVQEESYPEGLHSFVNPLFEWTYYDIRDKTLKETAEVPSQDQLKTRLDVSVQYHIDGRDAPRILQETGTSAQVIEVHLTPKLRSVLREQGKTIENAEDFFQEKTQDRLQINLQQELEKFLVGKGIIVSDVLIRDITLPTSLQRQIELKKEREQEVEKQKAELERFRTEQQQLVAAAEAEREAAEQEALRRKLIADAQAYEIEKLNEAISDNPAYIKLQALEALKAISSNPSSKIYFINGDSPSPLPLMHLGDELTPKNKN